MSKTKQGRRQQRVVSPPKHPYFGIPEHRVSISSDDFINGKMPAIIKRANKAGEMVTLNVVG